MTLIERVASQKDSYKHSPFVVYKSKWQTDRNLSYSEQVALLSQRDRATRYTT